MFRRFIGVFARPEHPLALFLDDLQWLDAATLELLEAVPHDDDDAFYFHRLALFHEEMHAEEFAVLAQTLGFDAGLVARIPTHAARPTPTAATGPSTTCRTDCSATWPMRTSR